MEDEGIGKLFAECFANIIKQKKSLNAIRADTTFLIQFTELRNVVFYNILHDIDSIAILILKKEIVAATWLSFKSCLPKSA